MPRPVTPAGILAAQLERASALAGGLEAYVTACTSPESPALARIAARTREREWEGGLEQEMLSGHAEGQLLKLLVRITRARRVLEIGMFTGYASLAMAEALPADGVVVACELDAEVAAHARESFASSPDGEKVDVRVGPALDTLDGLAGETFDLVFLDADKPGYVAYYERLLDTGILAADGLLCADNTLLQGEPWLPDPSPNGAAIAAFNERVAADPRVEQVLLPLRDGITLIRRV